MKKSLILLSSLLFFFYFTVHAQDKPDLQFSVQAGVPVSLHSNNYQNFSGPAKSFSYNLGFGMHYHAASWFNPGLEVNYFDFGYQEDVFSSLESGSSAIVLGVPNLTHSLSITLSTDFYITTKRENALPFLLLDIGAGRITGQQTWKEISSEGSVTLNHTYSSWGPVAAIGGGFKFPLTKTLDLKVDSRYEAWFDADGVSPVQYVPISASLYF